MQRCHHTGKRGLKENYQMKDKLLHLHRKISSWGGRLLRERRLQTEFSENTGRLTSNTEKLTNSVTEVFQRMRQSMAQTPFVAPPPHYSSTSAAWLLLCSSCCLCPLFSSNQADTTTAPWRCWVSLLWQTVVMSKLNCLLKRTFICYCWFNSFL